jgi:rubredoxin
MRCSLCGYEYNEKEAQRACANCPIMKGCKLVKCPKCGFETPPEPGWLKKFFKGGLKK